MTDHHLSTSSRESNFHIFIRKTVRNTLAISLTCGINSSCNLVSLRNRSLIQSQDQKPVLRVSDHPFYLFVHHNPQTKSLKVSQVTVASQDGNIVIGMDAFTNERRYFDLKEAMGNKQLHLPRPNLPLQFQLSGRTNPEGLIQNGVFAPGSYYKFSYKEAQETMEKTADHPQQPAEKIFVLGRIRQEGHTPKTISVRRSNGMIVSVPVQHIIWKSVELLEIGAPHQPSPPTLTQPPEILSEIGDLTMVYTQRIEKEAPYRYPTAGLNGPNRKNFTPDDENARLAFTLNREYPLTASDMTLGARYLYIIDQDQEIRMAPERQPGWGRSLKHGDLTPAQLTDAAIKKVTQEFEKRSGGLAKAALPWLRSQKPPTQVSLKQLSLFYLMEHRLTPDDFRPTKIGYFRRVAYAGGEARLTMRGTGEDSMRPTLLINANSSYLFARTDQKILNTWRTLELIAQLFSIYKDPSVDIEISL